MNTKIFARNLEITKMPAVMAALWITATLNAHAQFNFQTFNEPGGSRMWVFGISGNEVVGNDTAENFVYSEGSFTTPNVPGTAADIDGTNIVGYYQAPDYLIQSYLYNGTTTNIISFPGAADTFAQGICGTNIVGYYYNTIQNYGFLYNGISYTTINVPNAQGTYANAVSGTNIVGYYFDASFDLLGFLFNGSSYSTLSVPGSSGTEANGIDGTNIVGVYTGAGGYHHGFLYNGASYITFDVPGAVQTIPYGISGNTIAGFYRDAAGNQFGFLATPARPVLSISLSQTNLFLSWPTNFTNYALYQIAGLNSGIWTTVTSTPIVTNGQNEVILPRPPAPAAFYRLQSF